MKKILATATLGILIFTSSPAMANPTINYYQQSEIQNLSAWPRIRDGIISGLIGGSENNNNDYDSYDENYYNPPPSRPLPPPPPLRPHHPRPHFPHHPHHHHYY